MKISNKIILEGLLLVVLLFISYYLYKIGMNMRHDIPIIKGEVADDTSYNSSNPTVSTIDGKSFFNLDINKMNELATFTESVGNLKVSIEYPKYKPEMLNELKATYQAWRLNVGDILDDTLYATNSGASQNLEYIVNYEGVNSIDTQIGINNDISKNNINKVYSLIFNTYTYAGGVHGSSNVVAYTYNNGIKINNLYDLAEVINPKINSRPSDTTASVDSLKYFFPKIYNTIRLQLISSLKERMSKKELDKDDLSWLDTGISYNTTDLTNYNTWWVYTGNYPNAISDKNISTNFDKSTSTNPGKSTSTSADKSVKVPLINIHMGQYQIAPYVYGEFDAQIPVSELAK